MEAAVEAATVVAAAAVAVEVMMKVFCGPRDLKTSSYTLLTASSLSSSLSLPSLSFIEVWTVTFEFSLKYFLGVLIDNLQRVAS